MLPCGDESFIGSAEDFYVSSRSISEEDMKKLISTFIPEEREFIEALFRWMHGETEGLERRS